MLVTTKDMKNRSENYIESFFGRTSRINAVDKRSAAVESALRFALAFIFARFSFPDGSSPFAYTFACVGAGGIEGFFGLLGAVLGYMLSGFNVNTFRNIFSAVLGFMILWALGKFPFSKKHHFAPAVISTVSASTGFVYIDGVYSAILFVSETLCVYLSACAFGTVLSPRPAEPDLAYGVSAALTVSVLCASLSGILIFGVMSVGRTLAVVILMATAFKCGYSKACPLAIMMGIMADMTGGKEIFFTFVYTFSVLASCIFAKKGTFVFSLSYVLANLIASALLYESYFFLASLYECFASSVIFMLIPSGALSKFHALFPAPLSQDAGTRSRAYVKNRIDLTAEAFKELYLGSRDIVYRGTNDENIAAVFDRAAEISCRNCKNMTVCWQSGYELTLTVLNDLSEKMMRDGCISASDFPPHFAARCSNLELFTSALNSELRALVYRRLYKSKYSENLAAAYSHYADMYLILKNAASEIGGDNTCDRKTERKIQKYLRSMDAPLGVSAFRDRSGRLHIELFVHSHRQT